MPQPKPRRTTTRTPQPLPFLARKHSHCTYTLISPRDDFSRGRRVQATAHHRPAVVGPIRR